MQPQHSAGRVSRGERTTAGGGGNELEGLSRDLSDGPAGRAGFLASVPGWQFAARRRRSPLSPLCVFETLRSTQLTVPALAVIPQSMLGSLCSRPADLGPVEKQTLDQPLSAPCPGLMRPEEAR